MTLVSYFQSKISKCLVLYSVLTRVIKWLAAIKLVLKIDKNKCNEIHNKDIITFYISYRL